MHLRRALLLFAIVLGLAALATSVSRPPRGTERGERANTPTTPEATVPAGPSAGTELHLPRPKGGRSVTLASGQAATLFVSVEELGEVELPGLGLIAPAEPVTPARFELLVTEPGRYDVRFIPAHSGESSSLGRLVVR